MCEFALAGICAFVFFAIFDTLKKTLLKYLHFEDITKLWKFKPSERLEGF